MFCGASLHTCTIPNPSFRAALQEQNKIKWCNLSLGVATKKWIIEGNGVAIRTDLEREATMITKEEETDRLDNLNSTSAIRTNSIKNKSTKIQTSQCIKEWN